MKFFHVVLLPIALLLPSLASAATSAIILPTATGTYSEWTPNTGTTHWSTVDETPCNGTTDYVATSTLAKRDSYAVSLSSIPDNSIISAIAVTPCASRATTGTGSSGLNVFYRFNASSSSDLGSYAPTGTTPTVLATSTWSGLTLTKTSTSTLEVGMVYTSGTKGGRLSRVTAQLTYTQAPLLPTATTSAASSVASSSALLNGTGNPNGTSTTAWFRIATSTPGTCNDTFGTRVPLSGGASLGAGTSSVAYATTTTGLSQNTTYYYCAIAQNGNGKGYGGVQSFNTSYGPPTNISSDISTNQTWTNGIYVITNSIAVNSGVTLTINSGVIVKFSNNVSSVITVNGTLNANGTAGNMVYFTSYKDDTVGGDTNGDGNASSPAAGNWGTVKISSGGTGSFKYTVARDGGYSSSNANFYNNGGLLSVASSTVASAGLAGIYHAFGTTTVASTTIADNVGAYGVYSTGGSGLVDISTSYFSGNAIAGYFDLNNLVFKSHANSILNAASQVNAFQISGTPASSQTLEGGVPYVVNGLLAINPGVTLTVGSGVVAKFSGATSRITVGGNLFATGTVSFPIYFTSYKDDTVGGDTNGDAGGTSANAGDWVNIEVDSGGVATFSQVIARYSGTFAAHGTFFNNGGLLSISNSTTSQSGWAGVNHLYGTTTVASSTISDNMGVYGIYSSGGSGLFSISNSTFSGNGAAGQFEPTNLAFISHGNTIVNGASQANGFYVSGTPLVNQYWESGVPFIVNGLLTINSGITLKVEAGTILKFLGSTAGITVGGTLTADSAASSLPIYFTSYKDDTAGGDTNGDGNGSSPAGGNWGTIEVDAGATTTFNYVNTRYGGATLGKMIWNNGGIMAMNNSEVASSANNGVYQTSGTTTILTTDIHSNSYGFYVDGGAIASVHSSNIHDNLSYGVYYSPVFGSVPAENNYWGDGTWGPRIVLVQTSGVGDYISGGVNYAPYLDRVHYFNMASAGNFISAVHSKTIKYDASSTKYKDIWYPSVATWNKHAATLGGGGVVISTSTVNSALDLWVYDVSSSTGASLPYVAVYTDDHLINPTLNDNIKFNDYYMQMPSYTTSTKQNAATHELGHALGLGHSYFPNIMTSYVFGTTTLGTQDIFDYDYCWTGTNCQ